MRYKNQTVYYPTPPNATVIKLTGKNVRKATVGLIDLLGGYVGSTKSVYGTVRAGSRELPLRRIGPNKWRVIGDGDFVGGSPSFIC